MFQGNTYPRGLGNRIKRINWSSLLNNTQKTLNIINQAIPIVYQVKPIIGNAKTMFKIISAVKSDDNHTKINNNSKINNENNNTYNYTNKPVFYI